MSETLRASELSETQISTTRRTPRNSELKTLDSPEHSAHSWHKNPKDPGTLRVDQSSGSSWVVCRSSLVLSSQFSCLCLLHVKATSMHPHIPHVLPHPFSYPISLPCQSLTWRMSHKCLTATPISLFCRQVPSEEMLNHLMERRCKGTGCYTPAMAKHHIWVKISSHDLPKVRRDLQNT